MSVKLILDNSFNLQLVGEDEYMKDLKLFLCHGVRGLNGFNNQFLSQFTFKSDGHPRWDFTYTDGRSYNFEDWERLISLNLAWDCWVSARYLY